MLFKVTKNKVREDNPSLSVIDEFSLLSDQQLKWVFLVYDYDTPYKQLSLRNKMEKAAFRAGYSLEKGTGEFPKYVHDMMNGSNPKVNKAIKIFKELIYDEDQESLDSIKDLIANARDFIREPSSDASVMEKKVKLASNLTNLILERKKLESIIGVREETESETDNSDNEQLSTLDKYNQGLLDE